MYVLSLLASMKMEQNKVIVIGGNHHNTLGVIRSLGYKGLKSYVIVVADCKKPYLCYSKYVSQYKVLSSAEEIVDYLLKIKDANSRPVVISCADYVTAVLDSHRENLIAYYHLPIGKGNVEKVMDKDIMAKVAHECGIATPENYTFEELMFTDNIKYILKPLKSIEGSKADIAIIKSKAGLEHFLSTIHRGKFQIQNFIEKELEFQLIGCSLNAGEMVIIPGVSIILRQPENTNTGFLKYVGFDEFQYDGINACKKFIQTIGYSGLFSLEFLRGKDGKDYFMEINMRNDGNSICVTAAGVNLPYIWYCYCVGKDDWKNETANLIRKTIVMPEFDDFVNVLKRKITFLHWIKDVRKTDHFMEYDKTDTKPFYIGLYQQILGYCKLILEKMHINK